MKPGKLQRESELLTKGFRNALVGLHLGHPHAAKALVYVEQSGRLVLRLIGVAPGDRAIAAPRGRWKERDLTNHIGVLAMHICNDLALTKLRFVVPEGEDMPPQAASLGKDVWAVVMAELMVGTRPN